MRIGNRSFIAWGIGLMLWMTFPLMAANKETLQLLQQVSMIQQQLKDLQDAQIKNDAIIQKLTEQILDQVTRLSGAVDDLKKSNSQTQAAIGNKVDSFTGNLQVTQEGLDELKARLDRLTTDVAALKTTLQSIDAKIPSQTPETATPTGDQTAAPSTGKTPPAAAAPQGPDLMYEAAMKDYSANRLKLALGGFQQFLKYYDNTPLAGNAHFWIGQIFYQQENYKSAIDAFNTVVERYPDSNKLTVSIYKKGMALEALGQKTAALKEFRMLISRYPNSPEAKQASQEVSKLNQRGATSSRTATRRRK
ncbi:MAG: tol-pal system protein YbgF [Acidobacteriia bacterium]|nr:tol-pal system protein YbgF [Terriglobia bacterium]